LALLKV
ncbi:unnamed protein product, partial [Allacma fusca]